MKFETFIAVPILMISFWVNSPCRLVHFTRRFNRNNIIRITLHFHFSFIILPKIILQVFNKFLLYSFQNYSPFLIVGGTIII
jgi:hypothetical protein